MGSPWWIDDAWLARHLLDACSWNQLGPSIFKVICNYLTPCTGSGDLSSHVGKTRTGCCAVVHTSGKGNERLEENSPIKVVRTRTRESVRGLVNFSTYGMVNSKNACIQRTVLYEMNCLPNHCLNATLNLLGHPKIKASRSITQSIKARPRPQTHKANWNNANTHEYGTCHRSHQVQTSVTRQHELLCLLGWKLACSIVPSLAVISDMGSPPLLVIFSSNIKLSWLSHSFVLHYIPPVSLNEFSIVRAEWQRPETFNKLS